MNISNWFNNLLGKPTPRSNVTPGIKQPEEAPPPPVVIKEEKPKTGPTLVKGTIVEEDSVLSDLNTAKKYMAQKLGIASSKAGEKIGQVKGSNKAMKTIRTVIAVVVILVLAIIGFNIFRQISENIVGNGDEPIPTEVLSPTPINYRPYQPSKYANDSEIIFLEEKAETLEKEISRANLRDSSIQPPRVDYNVSFD